MLIFLGFSCYLFSQTVYWDCSGACIRAVYTYGKSGGYRESETQGTVHVQ